MNERVEHVWWARWAWLGAGLFALVYGALGWYWGKGGAGFPFGEGDVPDARAESWFGTATAQGLGPVIAMVGLAGLLLAGVLGLAGRRPAIGRWAGVCGWVIAFALLAVVPDARIMTAVGYAPIFLLGAPFGWPDANYFELAFPWPVVNMLICLAGGFLWAAASLAAWRHGGGACQSCGREPGRRGGTLDTVGRWAAWVAVVVPLFYAVVRWAWALGIPLLMSAEKVAELHATGLVWAGAGLATFAAAGSLLTLGLVRPWGLIWPRWVPGLAGRPVPRRFPLTFAGLVTVVLSSAGMTAVRVTDWTDPAAWLVSPMAYWPLWAAALGAATLGYAVRTRPACARCGQGKLVIGAS
ncbi:hypothetical protein OIE66_22500 [Nonomuraea sp. NBC_01738]|uniref:hypothetical protein n=1 Tax=Nonomuraea sp. NBC_01738 TaxID=2976003 RepID=UPI002E161828|nr:hypothetical protein OIE66_22500 [Nonomuraea sp. NBC_01738]